MHPNRSVTLRARALAPLALLCASAALAPSGALAADSSGGGVVAAGNPEVSDVRCVRRCVSGRTATAGSRVRVNGNFLDYTRRIVFPGKDGPIRAAYLERSTHLVKTIVPRGATSGRPFVVDTRGTRSNRSPRVLRVVSASQMPKEIFPVRGPHQYWDGFGAGRNHMGMDIGAACGTRLVSARDGRVQYRASHSAAGNYVVIDSANRDGDLMYAHLRAPAIVRVGQFVHAGDTIGYVGDTGRATGCHLHFEYWTGEWYGGGRAIDPEPYLRALDRRS